MAFSFFWDFGGINIVRSVKSLEHHWVSGLNLGSFFVLDSSASVYIAYLSEPPNPGLCT